MGLQAGREWTRLPGVMPERGWVMTREGDPFFRAAGMRSEGVAPL